MMIISKVRIFSALFHDQYNNHHYTSSISWWFIILIITNRKPAVLLNHQYSNQQEKGQQHLSFHGLKVGSSVRHDEIHAFPGGKPWSWHGPWKPKLVGGFNHLEKIWVCQWEGWQPIYEMENKKMIETTNQLTINLFTQRASGEQLVVQSGTKIPKKARLHSSHSHFHLKFPARLVCMECWPCVAKTAPLLWPSEATVCHWFAW